MNKKMIAFLMALAFAVSLAGCSAAANSQSASAAESGSSAVQAAGLLDVSQMFTDTDKDSSYEESTAKQIALSGESVTIREEGTYILSGTLENGQIIVDAAENAKVHLVFNGVQVNSDTSAALYVKQADKVVVTLAQGSSNTLSNTAEFVAVDDTNIDGVVFSKADLTFNGQGSLAVNAAYGHGIVCKDDLVLISGTYTVNAAEQGLTANDSVRIADGTFNITAGKDAIHAENAEDTALGFIYIANGTFTLKAEGDGLDASGVVQVDDGTMDVTAGGGSANASAKQSEQIAAGGSRPQRGQPPEGDMQPRTRGEKPGDLPQSANGKGEDDLPVAGATQSSQDGSTKSTAATETETVTAVSLAAAAETDDTEIISVAGATQKTESAAGSAASGTAEANSAEQSATQQDDTDTVSTKGIKAGTGLYIQGGTFKIDAQDDALHSNSDLLLSGGELTLSAGDDGAHADAKAAVSGGTLNITKSYEGLEGQSIELSGGTVNITASDDGLNAAGGKDFSGTAGGDTFRTDESAAIVISDGKLTVDAGGDGVDSNGDLTVTGGETYVSGPTNDGNGALDYAGSATVSGGIFLAAGSSGMAQNFGENSTQGAILVTTQATAEAGTTVTLKNADGETLASYTPSKQFNSVLVSSGGLVKGETYTLEIGQETQTVTLSNLIYGAAAAQGMGGK